MPAHCYDPTVHRLARLRSKLPLFWEHHDVLHTGYQDHPRPSSAQQSISIHGQQKESGSFRRHSPSSSSCSVVQRLVCGTDAKARQVGVGTASLSNYLSSQRNKSQNSKISPQSNSRRLYIMVCRVFLALLLQLSSQLFSQSPLLHFSLLHGYTVRFYKINSRLRLVSVIQS